MCPLKDVAPIPPYTHKKRFITIFPGLEAVLLSKDVGAIPYFLSKVCGWSSTIAYLEKKGGWRSYKGGEYEKEVRLVSIGRFGHKVLNAMKIAWFLAFRTREYDVVNFYQDSILYMASVLPYRIINPSGRVYFKLDMSHLQLELIESNRRKFIASIRRLFKGWFSWLTVDLYTVESTAIYEALLPDRYYRGRLAYFPNGFACDIEIDIDRVLKEKENILLTAGRIGAYPKHNELLIDAVALVDKELIKGWKVYLAGPVDGRGIIKYAEDVAREHPHLKGAFIFTGNLERGPLFELYKRSRIFCLTSRWESFGMVLPEAMYFGDYLIAPDFPAAIDLTGGGTVGALFHIGDVHGAAEAIEKAVSGGIDLIEGGKRSHEFVKSRFNWRLNIKDLENLLLHGIRDKTRTKNGKANPYEA